MKQLSDGSVRIEGSEYIALCDMHTHDPKPSWDSILVYEYTSSDGKRFTSWITWQEHEALKRYEKRLKRLEYLFFFSPAEYLKGMQRRDFRRQWDDNYYIYVLRGNTRQLAMKNRITGKVYKCVGYSNSGMEITRYKYLEDATMMGL